MISDSSHCWNHCCQKRDIFFTHRIAWSYMFHRLQSCPYGFSKLERVLNLQHRPTGLLDSGEATPYPLHFFTSFVLSPLPHCLPLQFLIHFSSLPLRPQFSFVSVLNPSASVQISGHVPDQHSLCYVVLCHLWVWDLWVGIWPSYSCSI